MLFFPFKCKKLKTYFTFKFGLYLLKKIIHFKIHLETLYNL